MVRRGGVAPVDDVLSKPAWLADHRDQLGPAADRVAGRDDEGLRRADIDSPHAALIPRQQVRCRVSVPDLDVGGALEAQTEPRAP